VRQTNDPYLTVVAKHWRHIVTLYLTFQDKRPVMLIDLQDAKIFAYPYDQFKAGLSKRSQALLKLQYAEARSEDKIVVFVRDSEEKKLVSYCLA